MMKQFYIFIICFAIWSGCYAEEKKELDKFDIVEKFLNTLHIQNYLIHYLNLLLKVH